MVRQCTGAVSPVFTDTPIHIIFGCIRCSLIQCRQTNIHSLHISISNKILDTSVTCRRHSGLIFNALFSGLSSLSFEPLPGTLGCVLGQDTVLSQYFPPPRRINGHQLTQCQGGNPLMVQRPIQGGVEILLVTSCQRNWDKLQSDGPLGYVRRRLNL